MVEEECGCEWVEIEEVWDEDEWEDNDSW